SGNGGGDTGNGSGNGGDGDSDNGSGNGGDGDNGNGSGNVGGGDNGNGGGDNGNNSEQPGQEDTTPPAAPTITSVTDAVPSIVGAVQNNQVTNDSQPEISGTGEAGALITLFDNGKAIGSVEVGADGSWSFKPASPLGEGSHTLTATATDAAGNSSSLSADFTIIVDTVPPEAVTELEISDDGLYVSGVAEAGSQVTIYDSQQNLLGTVLVDSSGTFTLRLSSAQTHGESLSAHISDAAGNEGATASFTGSTSGAPDAPTITGAIDDTAPATGTLTSGQSTNDVTPTLTGTAGVGATVTVYDNDRLIGTVIAVDGTWTIELSNVAEGEHSYTATQTINGITSGSSLDFNVTVDITPPAPAENLQVSANG
ncbi:Ig-like domain-containing protein, partial [Intestinirhabdus alba]|uniref:Ig-like domain-containing protein n=1 Tax=Intestinirhabdus alba TaxID=2899544 RepID=UPI001E3B2013